MIDKVRIRLSVRRPGWLGKLFPNALTFVAYVQPGETASLKSAVLIINRLFGPVLTVESDVQF